MTVDEPARLRHVDLNDLMEPPEPALRTDEDVEKWKHTKGYRDYWLFLRGLNEAVVGWSLPPADAPCSQPVSALLTMLDTLDGWIDETPPVQTPQRFGNAAFRTWGDRLNQTATSLLETLLGPRLSAATPHLAPLLKEAFGSFQRLDYGTGHETCFALFLCCLTLLRFVEPEPNEQRALVLHVFMQYMRLCWRLQDVYMLEPAGSHGVWGLDDYCFLGYVFGSAQLRDQTEFAVSATLRRPLPEANLYCLCIGRIDRVKQGPFHEHSSQLYAIATEVLNWDKVNTGLLKMYEGEVLSKRVVVQHIPLGGLVSLEPA